MKTLLTIVAVIMFMSISVIAEEGPKPYGIQHPEWQQGFLQGLRWGMPMKDTLRTLNKNGIWVGRTIKGSIETTQKGRHRRTHYVYMGGSGKYGNVDVINIKLWFVSERFVSVEFHARREGDKLYKQSLKMFGDGMERITTVGRPMIEYKKRNPNYRFDKIFKCDRFFTYTLIRNKLDYIWSTKHQSPVRLDNIRICNWSCLDINDKDKSAEKSYFRFQDFLRKRNTEKQISCNKCYGGKCRDCNGSGSVKGHPLKRCSGTVKYPNIKIPHRPTYINRLNIPVACRACRGSGYSIDKSKNTKACPKCKKTGKCTACKGTGTLETNTLNKGMKITFNTGTKTTHITEEEVNNGSRNDEIKRLESQNKLVFE